MTVTTQEPDSRAARRRPEVSVSVVITTTGREELRRAVSGALAQTHPVLEVIVVDDGRPAGQQSTGTDDPRVRVIRTGGVGGSAARNRGIDEAVGSFVALLDDDDIWLPWKLERQLDLLSAAGDPSVTVATCRAFVEALNGVYPKQLYVSGSVAEYLFCKTYRHLRHDAFLQTSSLLIPNHLAKAVLFQPGLPAHQDWDWLVRAQAAGAHFVMAPDALYIYSAATGSSTTSAGRLQAEQEWATATLDQRSIALFGYFMTFAAPRSVDFGRYDLLARAVARAFTRGRFHGPSFMAGLGELVLNLRKRIAMAVVG